MELNQTYWDNRYKKNDIAWDLGNISKPIKQYVDQLVDKDCCILIPGCGNGYEAEYLFKNGFLNVFVADVSQTALANLKSRVPDFPDNNLINEDFFKINQLFDLILEQTFFCALNPELRNDYVAKTHHLLKDNGKLVGLLFNKELNIDKPPFGGNEELYINLFSKLFKIDIIDDCYNSEESRIGKELFIKFIKQNKTS